MTLFLSACQIQTTANIQTFEEKPEKVHLTMFGFKSGKTQIEGIETILEGYMKKNPGTIVTYEGLNNKDGYLSVLYRRLDANTQDDLFMLNPTAFSTAQQKGYFGDPIMDLSGEPFIEEYSDLAKQLMTVEGFVPAVPMEMTAFGLFVNETKLRAYGLSVPETLSEFVEACRIIKAAGETPIAASAKVEGFTPCIVATGVALHDIAIDADLSEMTPEDYGACFRPGFELIKAFTDEGYWDTEKALATPSWTTEIEDFAAGEYAFMPVGTWEIGFVKALNPDFDYRLMGLPLSEDGCVTNIRAASPVCLSSESPHPKAAKALLETIAEPKNIMIYVKSQSSLSPLTHTKNNQHELKELNALVDRKMIYSDALPAYGFNVNETVGAACIGILEGTMTVDDAVRAIEQASEKTH